MCTWCIKSIIASEKWPYEQNLWFIFKFTWKFWLAQWIYWLLRIVQRLLSLVFIPVVLSILVFLCDHVFSMLICHTVICFLWYLVLKNWENLNGTTCFGFSWLPCFPLKMISHWFTATRILKAFPFCMASVFATFRNKSLFFPWFLNVLCIVVCVGGPVVYPFGLSCSFLLLSSCQCLIIELLKSANGGVIGVNWESVLSSAYL